ncbi:MAG: SDR family NAD(P)-dependent oxidoreductase [Bacteroides sp.]|nr:SDR family NAD(P)-dependent oxidoreductase [Bacteroides sp.]
MNILIIGATSGIGHNLWEHYVSSGHNVIVVGRRRELLDDMVRSCPEHT